MRSRSTRALTLGVILTVAASAPGAVAAAADDGLWLHLRVREADGGKVTVNLPLALIEKALPMLADGHARSLRFDHHGIDTDIEELRALWREVRQSPDMTFVTVEEDGEKTRVWKKDGRVFVEVRGRDAEERVDIRLPVAAVDAFLAGDHYDLRAAVRALVDHGGGDFVEVRDHEDQVRVWVDREAEAE